ncbi:MAG TPA: Uma2 family endonuclease [Chthonomonadaceae bacterium]|nr:Uma2 family endonuclease [Chthonomonadaceae bacterium]
MVAHPKPCYVTPEEYLERERAAETKSEYYDGVIVAMAGASPEHDRIAVDILRHLGNQLERSPCEPFSSDMRVRVPTCNRYYYPDVSVACGGSQFEALVGVRSLLNPKLIVEVLSESTEKNDRTDKYDCYRTLASLATYVLVAQDRPRIEVFTRQPDDTWRHEVAKGLEAVLALPAIGCELKLADIYARVEFPPAPTEPAAE